VIATSFTGAWILMIPTLLLYIQQQFAGFDGNQVRRKLYM
jgi:hypothetical protein